MITNIAIIEPEASFRSWLEKTLIQEGYKVYTYELALDFLANLDKHKTDLVICSYYLPRITPETFYKQLAEDFPEMPVIFISQAREEGKIVDLLAYKNVDFILGPITDVELKARVSASLLPVRTLSDPDEELTIQNVTLCTKSLQVKKGDEIIVLSPTEFKLLHYLMKNKGRVLSRDMILSRVWGTTSDVTDRIVDVYIGYLREKIDDKNEKKLIETVPGFGYRVAD